MEEINKIKDNNEKIIELKNTLKEYYNLETSNINIHDIQSDSIQNILNKQREDIARLNTLIDTESQKVAFKTQKKLKELKEIEPDKIFSQFYRQGKIVINQIEVSIDKFYIKELEKDNKIIFKFICTDSRIDKNLFNMFDDSDYELKNIYKLKDSKIFYDMYLDSILFKDNKIQIDSEEKLNLFKNYINKWTKEKHQMVAETLIN